jgi:hypothetical protein
MQELERRILISLYKHRELTLSKLRRYFHRVNITDRDIALSSLVDKKLILCKKTFSKQNGKILTTFSITDAGEQNVKNELNLF